MSGYCRCIRCDIGYGTANQRPDSRHDNFLGTQGDPRDTQSDIFLALIGSVTALLLFARVHDRQIQTVQSDQRAT